jgi:hypothetical protein
VHPPIHIENIGKYTLSPISPTFWPPFDVRQVSALKNNIPIMARKKKEIAESVGMKSAT